MQRKQVVMILGTIALIAVLAIALAPRSVSHARSLSPAALAI